MSKGTLFPLVLWTIGGIAHGLCCFCGWEHVPVPTTVHSGGEGISRSVKFVCETSCFKLAMKFPTRNQGPFANALFATGTPRGGLYQALFACVPPSQLQTP